MKFLGIKLAPLWVPLERRVQTLGVALFVFVFLQGVGLIGLATLLYVLCFTKYYWLSLVYFAWYFYDKSISSRGGRRSQWAREWLIWKHFSKYFPMSLIKTVDLDADKNYLFCIHPHGKTKQHLFGSSIRLIKQYLKESLPYRVLAILALKALTSQSCSQT